MDALLAHAALMRATYLLLLYFYGFEAAAHCPAPRGGENTVLTNEAILLNDFPEGTTVTLECANGFETDKGSGNMRCVNGTWAEPDLLCKKKDCGPPKPQPHMTFDTSKGTLFASVIKVICDEGYVLVGSGYKQCYAVGWIGRAKCEIITCEKPAQVTNGRSSWVYEDKPQYGNTIEYSCNEGYTLSSTGHITCTKTGQYDFQPPECNSVTTEEIITSQISTTTTPTTTQTQEASSATEATEATEATSPTEETFSTTTVLPLQPGNATEQKEDANNATTSPDTNTNTGRTVFLSVLGGGLIIGFVGAIFYRSHKKRKGSATMPI